MPKLRSTRKSKAPYRGKARILKDRAEIASRLLRGQMFTTISSEMNLPYELIKFDVRAIQKDWRESAVRDLDEATEIAVRKLEHLEAVYWMAWDRSCGQRVRVTENGEISGRGGAKLKVINGSTMKEELYGDPRFLLGVRQCIMDIAKIRGVIQDSRPSDTAPIIPTSNHATVIIMPPVNPPRPIPSIQVASSVRQG